MRSVSQNIRVYFPLSWHWRNISTGSWEKRHMSPLFTYPCAVTHWQILIGNSSTYWSNNAMPPEMPRKSAYKVKAKTGVGGKSFIHNSRQAYCSQWHSRPSLNIKISCDRPCLGIQPKYVSYSKQRRIPFRSLITVGKCSERQAKPGKLGHTPSPLPWVATGPNPLLLSSILWKLHLIYSLWVS